MRIRWFDHLSDVELQTLTTTDIQLLSMFCHRCVMFKESFHPAKAFLVILVLSCTLFFLARRGPCSTNGMGKSAEYSACGSYGDNQRAGFQDIAGGDASSCFTVGSSMTHPNIESVCTSSNLLCFPLTMPGFFPKEHNLERDALEVSRIQFESPLSIGTNQANGVANNLTWLYQNGMFKSLNGRTVSCLLNSEKRTLELPSFGTESSNQNGSPSCSHTLLSKNSKNVRLKNYEMNKPDSFGVSSSPIVGISPPILDWGKNLFFPSVAFLTVVNSLSDSVLHVYEPFSANTQIYPCNSSNTLCSLGGDEKVPSEIKALKTAEADKLVLGNWKSQGTTSGMSVLDDCEVLFPMVQIGSHHSKWITVKNPSQQPVVMQLILSSGEIVDECRDTDGFVEPSCGSLVLGDSTILTRYGFSIAESALTEAYVHPHGRASFGPILFHPSNRCVWRSSALFRSNLSGVERLSLRGFGGSLSLVLFEGSELIESVEFNLNLPIPHDVTPDIFLHVEETALFCSQQLSKELYAKNVGDLPLEVISIEVSGAGCELDEFVVHNGKGFSLDPGETTKLLISYQTDFSAAMVHGDLEVALASDIFLIPMKANSPVFMLNLCKKSVLWMPLEKFATVIALLVSLVFLVFCFVCVQMITSGYQYCFYKNEKSSITTKSSHMHRNHRNSRSSVPGEMNCLLRSIDEAKASKQASRGRCPDSRKGVPVNMTTQHAKLLLENHWHTDGSSFTLKEKSMLRLSSTSVVVETSDSVEASRIDNLTVRVGKDKGRRRRKRKGGGATLTGVLDVSSSQKGNSTPSSPLSPVTTLTLNHECLLSPDVVQLNVSRHPFIQTGDRCCEKGTVREPAVEPKVLEHQLPARAHINNQYSSSPEHPSVSRKTAGKPVLLPSATFPCTGRAAPSLLCSPSLASKSTIALHARAPGSKLYQKTVTGEQEGCRDEYVYDIWGDHFSGLSLIFRSKNIDSINHRATRNDSNSFFVSGPEALMRNSQLRSVSCSKQGG